MGQAAPDNIVPEIKSPPKSTLNLPDIELVSAAAHEAWMKTKRTQGITSRKSETGEELMVPYAELSEPAKDLDRGCVKAIYEAIEAVASK